MTQETADREEVPGPAKGGRNSSGWPKWLKISAPSAALLLVLIAVYSTVGRESNVISDALIDEPVPEFVLPQLSPAAEIPGYGRNDLIGQVSVVNLFASWCYPCRMEHPHISQISRSGLAKVYGHNFKDQPEDAANWLRKNGNPYHAVGSDASGRVAAKLGVVGIPDTLIIDKRARIRFRQKGVVTAKALNRIILPLIKKLRRE